MSQPMTLMEFASLAGVSFGTLQTRRHKGDLSLMEAGFLTTAQIWKIRKCTHGKAHTPLWSCWVGMIDRCTRPANKVYHRYGGRGIKVCARWMEFGNFYLDMGERPPNHSIERIDNDGGYEPANCRWATNAEQSRNRRSSVNITYKGRTQCVMDWALELGISDATLHSRLAQGKTAEQILFMKKWAKKA